MDNYLLNSVEKFRVWKNRDSLGSLSDYKHIKKKLLHGFMQYTVAIADPVSLSLSLSLYIYIYIWAG